MRKTIFFACLAALALTALALTALPTLADQAPEVTAAAAVQAAHQATGAPAEVTLDQIFTADAASAEAGEAVEAVGGQEPLFRAGENCGGVICGKGTYCCNASCAWCRPYGVSCIQIACN